MSGLLLAVCLFGVERDLLWAFAWFSL